MGTYYTDADGTDQNCDGIDLACAAETDPTTEEETTQPPTDTPAENNTTETSPFDNTPTETEPSVTPTTETNPNTTPITEEEAASSGCRLDTSKRYTTASAGFWTMTIFGLTLFLMRQSHTLVSPTVRCSVAGARAAAD